MAGCLPGSALPPSGTCVLQQSLWGIGSVYNLHQLVQHHGNVWLHFGPCGNQTEKNREEIVQKNSCDFNTGDRNRRESASRCEWERDSPICIDISPIAHVALLHTDINSGFKLVPSMGIKSAERSRARQSGERRRTQFRSGASALAIRCLPMHGLTCWKQALVRSPSRANEL